MLRNPHCPDNWRGCQPYAPTAPYFPETLLAKENSVSPMVINIFIERLDELALDRVDHKSATWLTCVDDNFVVWSHGPSRLRQFFHHFNSVIPSIKLTMEIETNTILYRSWAS
jgi:hypothetical protein